MYRRLFLAMLAWSPCSAAYGATGQRHVVLVQADQEIIWGSYYLGLHNPTSQPQIVEAVVALPLETIDLQAGSGLTNNDIVLGENELRIKKESPPGMQVVSVNFKVKVGQNNLLTFQTATDIEQFSIAASLNNQVTLFSEFLKPGLPAMLGPDKFVGLSSTELIPKGSKIVITIAGIPSNRQVFWLLGAVFFLVLLLSCVGFVYKTRNENIG